MKILCEYCIHENKCKKNKKLFEECNDNHNWGFMHEFEPKRCENCANWKPIEDGIIGECLANYCEDEDELFPEEEERLFPLQTEFTGYCKHGWEV